MQAGSLPSEPPGSSIRIQEAEEREDGTEKKKIEKFPKLMTGTKTIDPRSSEKIT